MVLRQKKPGTAALQQLGVFSDHLDLLTDSLTAPESRDQVRISVFAGEIGLESG